MSPLAMPPVPADRPMRDDELEKALAWFMVERPINPHLEFISPGEFPSAIATALPAGTRHPVGVLTELNGGSEALSRRINALCWRYMRLGLVDPYEGTTRFVLTERGAAVLPAVVEDGELLLPGAIGRRLGALDALPAGVVDYATEAEKAFEAGLYRSTAVMLGAASEALLDALSQRLEAHSAALRLRAAPTGGALARLSWAALSTRERRRDLTAYLDHDPEAAAWTGDLPGLLEAANAVRLTRNEAGHPTLAPISRDDCWGFFVLFPRIATAISLTIRALDSHP